MVRTAAVVATVGFGVIATFQLALALGAPFGEASWGGRWPGRLPAGLRLASTLAAVIWVVAALVVLARAGFDVPLITASAARWGGWAVVGLLALGVVMNALSRSRWERFLWAPLALGLAVLSFLVARGPA